MEASGPAVSANAEATSDDSAAGTTGPVMAPAGQTSVPESAPPARGPAWWQWLLILTVLPLGLTAPFGTTILGLAAISSIRHSRGQLSGLPLAIADALFFPLLILHIIVGGAVIYLISAIFGRGLDAGLAVSLFLILSIILDFFIARAVWRRASDGM
jgi:hypothetical protein